MSRKGQKGRFSQRSVCRGEGSVCLFATTDALSDFLLFCQAKQLSPVTVKWYREILGHFANESPLAFDQKAVLRYIAHLQNKEKHIYSQTTVNMHLRALRAFCHWCLEQELIDKNPMQGIRIKRTRTLHTIPTDQELHKLLIAFSKGRTGKRDRAIFLLMLDSGIRPGELASLQTDEIDWEGGRAIVRGKTGPRQIYFTSKTGKAMAIYARTRKPSPGIRSFFVSHAGQPITQNCIVQLFIRARKRAGVERFHPYLLRHISATLSIRAGMNPLVLQRLMGHSTLEMTQGYVSMADGELKEAQRRASPVERLR